MILETDRLILRRLETDDALRLSEYRNKDEVKKYQSWDKYSLLTAKRRCRQSSKVDLFRVGKDYNLAIVDKQSNTLIGDLFVCNISRDTISLGYTLDSAYWHQGYAYEILSQYFEYLKVNEYKKVLCYIYPENIASKKLLDKFEFKKFSSSHYYGDEGYRKYL